MVTLKRNIRRLLTAVCATKTGRICSPDACGARPVVMEIGTDETIRFRVKGTRTTYDIHISSVLAIAQINKIVSSYRDKMEQYRIKRKMGLRVKKPRKPYIPSNLI